jgi:NADPH-dependent 2,4-dienoyl-CoA reductase/sulfur reductase-like enzyme
VVIVGSSFIGMEAASTLAKQANVTVVGMEKVFIFLVISKVPFERVLGPAVGAALGALTEKSGVTLKMESLVDRFDASGTIFVSLMSDSRPGCVGNVILKSGEKLPADFVILGAGVSPKTDYLKESEIKLDRDGGISVEPSMKIPNIDNVYAVGDLARYKYHFTDEMVRIEHWNVAENQGRLVAKNIIAAEKNESLQNFVQVGFS